MNLKTLYKLYSLKKQLKQEITHLSNIGKMQSDLHTAEENEKLQAVIRALKQLARSSHNTQELSAALERAAAAIDPATTCWAPLHLNGYAENFEVILVALAVAMAFRCYFFQPFKIPTGSMQPTLYGIHTDASTVPGLWDKPVLNCLKWFVTGDWYTEIRVADGGIVTPISSTLKPGYISFKVAGKIYHIPSGAIVQNGMINPNALIDLDKRTGRIKSGGLLWKGTVKAGDHVFVNRLTWNFRKPRRGEVMVFSTTGIPGLPEGTHYIKRMCGMPNEEISITPPFIHINGEQINDPYTIRRVSEKWSLSNTERYAGYQLIPSSMETDTKTPLFRNTDVVKLKEDEYYALGDNTMNSRDSRFWGPVPEKRLLGPGAFIYWPFTRFRIID